MTCCLTERELAERVTRATGERLSGYVLRRLMAGRTNAAGVEFVESSERQGIVERCTCSRGGWRLTADAEADLGVPLREGIEPPIGIAA